MYVSAFISCDTHGDQMRVLNYSGTGVTDGWLSLTCLLNTWLITIIRKVTYA